MVFDLKNLQNGSDVRGIAWEGVPGEEVNLTEENVGRIAGAFIYWLSQKVQKNPVMLKVCVGHDPRVSAETLKSGILKAFNMWGVEGHGAGLASTPAMFMATVLPQFEFDGSIMITGSHLPYNRNGLKFFTAEGGLEKEDVAEILRLANKYTFIGEVYDEHKTNVMQMYAAYLRQMLSMGLKDVPGGLKGMHIVVDAGNGSGGFFANEVLAPLGADISGSVFLEPDGTFPNHQPNPEDKDALASIRKAVLDNNADLGIIFDADVDRSSAVGPDGKLIAKDALIALAAAIAAEDYPGGTVVTDSVTSNALTDYLENDLGLKHFRYKRGYRNVIDKAKELMAEGETAFLAIETSGHAAYSDNYFLDDGAFLAAQIVINAAKLKAEGKTINALIEGFKQPAESWSIRLKLNAEDYSEFADRVLEDMKKWVGLTEGLELAEPNYEGVRVNFDIDGSKGWFLMRKSLHEAILPLDIMSADNGGIRKVLPHIGEFLMKYEGIEVPR